jgi:hypothetical protein
MRNPLRFAAVIMFGFASTCLAIEVAPGDSTTVYIDTNGNQISSPAGTVTSCSTWEEGACIYACIGNGPGSGSGSPVHPLLVSGGCYRESTGGGYTVGCACTWKEATINDTTGGGGPCNVCGLP